VVGEFSSDKSLNDDDDDGRLGINSNRRPDDGLSTWRSSRGDRILGMLGSGVLGRAKATAANGN